MTREIEGTTAAQESTRGYHGRMAKLRRLASPVPEPAIVVHSDAVFILESLVSSSFSVPSTMHVVQVDL